MSDEPITPKSHKGIIIGGFIVVALGGYVLYKKHKSTTAATTASNSVASTGTPEIIYPQSLSGSDTQTQYDSLMTGIENSAGATSNAITQAQGALEQFIASHQNNGRVGLQTPPPPPPPPPPGGTAANTKPVGGATSDPYATNSVSFDGYQYNEYSFPTGWTVSQAANNLYGTDPAGIGTFLEYNPQYTSGSAPITGKVDVPNLPSSPVLPQSKLT